MTEKVLKGVFKRPKSLFSPYNALLVKTALKIGWLGIKTLYLFFLFQISYISSSKRWFWIKSYSGLSRGAAKFWITLYIYLSFLDYHLWSFYFPQFSRVSDPLFIRHPAPFLTSFSFFKFLNNRPIPFISASMQSVNRMVDTFLHFTEQSKKLSICIWMYI